MWMLSASRAFRWESRASSTIVDPYLAYRIEAAQQGRCRSIAAMLAVDLVAPGQEIRKIVGETLVRPDRARSGTKRRVDAWSQDLERGRHREICERQA